MYEKHKIFWLLTEGLKLHLRKVKGGRTPDQKRGGKTDYFTAS